MGSMGGMGGMGGIGGLMRALFPISALVSIALAGLQISCSGESSSPTEAPKFSMGNGEANWIVTEGATRDGSRFTFPEVRIDGNGWLVMHPFEDGKPNGNVYVGATFVPDGENRDVGITIDSLPDAGDMFIVMLHRDVNENGNFDFVFVDERNVVDKAVFEGPKMIGHAFAAPE
jgi:hypothetical protein